MNLTKPELKKIITDIQFLRSILSEFNLEFIEATDDSECMNLNDDLNHVVEILEDLSNELEN